MERCKFVLQDDTGIPAAVLTDRKWQMHPYGRYIRPIDMFRGYYQKRLAEIYAGGTRAPLDFGVGYHYRVNDCNMLLAARDENSVLIAAAPAAPPPAADPVPATAPGLSPASAAATVVASNEAAGAPKSPRKKLAELEDEELRIRADASLTKAERMRKLREIWKQQLAVMGKTSA